MGVVGRNVHVHPSCGYPAGLIQDSADLSQTYLAAIIDVHGDSDVFGMCALIWHRIAQIVPGLVRVAAYKQQEVSLVMDLSKRGTSQ